MVEIPAPDDPPSFSKSVADDPEYFTSLLIAQLESQRMFFEDRLSQTDQKLSSQLEKLKLDSSNTIKSQQEQFNSIRTKLESDLATLASQIQELKERISTVKKEKKTLKSELEAEKLISKQFLDNQSVYEKMVKDKDEEIESLKEQVNDLLTHFQAQEAFINADDQVKQGKLVLKQVRRSNKR